jgi:hypothetical protein
VAEELGLARTGRLRKPRLRTCVRLNDCEQLLGAAGLQTTALEGYSPHGPSRKQRGAADMTGATLHEHVRHVARARRCVDRSHVTYTCDVCMQLMEQSVGRLTVAEKSSMLEQHKLADRWTGPKVIR